MICLKEKYKKIFSAWLLFSSLYTIHAQISPSFTNINIEHGLSNHGVTCILQDHDGFMWFGTWDGLNKYDGKKIVYYKPTRDSKNGLSNNNISCLFEDSEKCLWIGTKSDGLNRMNLLDGKIENYSNEIHGIEAAWITSVIEDKHKNIWISTENGVFILDSMNRNKTAKLFRKILADVYVSDIKADKYGNLWFSSNFGLYYFSERLRELFCSKDYINNPKFPLDYLTSLEIDKQGNLWISTWKDGLIKASFDINNANNKKRFTEQFFNLNFEKIDLSSYFLPGETEFVHKLFVDSRNNLWILLWGKGLLFWKDKSLKMEFYHHDEKAYTSINNNYPLCVFEDESGLIWAGSVDGGVNKINLNAKLIYTYSGDLNNKFGRVGPILQTSDNKLYIGARDAGLLFTNFNGTNFRADPDLKFSGFNVSRTNPYAISHHEITALFEDSNQNLWVGTLMGLNFISKQERKNRNPKILKYFSESNNNLSLSDDNITHIIEDNKGKIWVGTMHHGLNRLDSLDKFKTPCFTRFDFNYKNKNGISHFRIRTMLIDKEKNLWVGTDCGLDRVIYNRNGQAEFKVIYSEDNIQGLSNNSICCINEDDMGNLWIGTNNGLSILKKEHKYLPNPEFINYGMKEGLPSEYILSIQFDDKNQVWLTTIAGLVKMVPEDMVFNTFNKSDGFRGSVFTENSGYVNSDGLLFFGDLNGLNIFDPKEIKQPEYIPKTKLVSFYTEATRTDKRLNPTYDNSLLNRDLLEFNYMQRNFSIEFISLCFIATEKNEYQYKLDGFDKEWINAGTNNIANYTNIPPGKYVFKVRGSNGSVVWSPIESSIEVRVNSPWWFSTYAFIVYTLIVFILVYSLARINLLQIRLKHKTLIDKLELEKIEEVNQAKLEFFTNISHDFRTPLTVILISIKKIKEIAGQHWKELKPINMVEKNVNILLRMVNQIMDIRKIDNQKMTAKPCKYDIIAFVEQIYEALIPLAEEKQIDYSFTSDVRKIELYFDYSMMEKVFWNILSNSFKYTQIGGRITITIKQTSVESDNSGSFIQINIKDNGPGIAKEDLPKIFDRFYQSGSKNSERKRGTGLGLSIAKEMLAINKAHISAESEENIGTEFSVLLPVENPELEKLAVPNTAIVDDILNESKVYMSDAGTNMSQFDKELVKDEKEKPLLLIVEDNEDLRLLLKNTFSVDYKIELAEDGIEGLEIALETMPDIIVADIVMPRMNGLKLCEKIKNDIKTSHIPIILLTAKATIEQQLEGLNTNADDYITKPFNLSILDARIKNLLRERKYLKDKFKNAVQIDTKKLELSSIDQRFIDKAIMIIEKNLSEVNFSVDDFANELGMSRSSMYRKILAITGQSAKEFIRDFRIKKAAKLLKDGDFTVSDVAFEVGFISRSYFTKCFTEYFKMLPSKYIQTKGLHSESDDSR